MSSFVMCARNISKGKFVSEPGPSVYLDVPGNSLVPLPEHKIRRDVWIKRLRQAAVWGQDMRQPEKVRGDVLVFIHGYNNDQLIVMERHRQLTSDLRSVGYMGAVVSFDWPSANMPLNYLEDRHDAKKTALNLMKDGIYWLAKEQTPDCTINVHLLGHSTGAYVIREAFDDADDALLSQLSWIISQVIFIGGDVSADSMSLGNPSSEAVYRHCVRFTNYSNRYDSVLKLSNTKRVGMSPRVGREGLPSDVPKKAVNVDCSEYFNNLESNPKYASDQSARIGSFDHSWHIGNKVFAMDMFETIKGDWDRLVIPTRELVDGVLRLKK